MFLENLSDDGDSRVDGVGDNEDKRLGARLGDTGGKVANDASVDLEQIISVRV